MIHDRKRPRPMSFDQAQHIVGCSPRQWRAQAVQALLWCLRAYSVSSSSSRLGTRNKCVQAPLLDANDRRVTNGCRALWPRGNHGTHITSMTCTCPCTFGACQHVPGEAVLRGEAAPLVAPPGLEQVRAASVSRAHRAWRHEVDHEARAGACALLIGTLMTA